MGKIISINKKNFEDEELLHELSISNNKTNNYKLEMPLLIIREQIQSLSKLKYLK